MKEIIEKTLEVIRGTIPAVLCLVVETKGSTPRKAGSRMLVFPDGSVNGSVGGGSVEREVIRIALEVMGKGIPEKRTFQLESDLEMHCGGYMEVFIEPVNPAPKLYVFGAGHIGRAIVRYARDFGFTVTVIDHREGIFRDTLFAGCTILNQDYFTAIGTLSFDQLTYCVIVTPKHEFDEQILGTVAHLEHAYIGMLGSERKVAVARKHFLEAGTLTEGQLDAIDMPIGIPFHAETPEEIAISILAKLIDVKNRRMNPRNKK